MLKSNIKKLVIEARQEGLFTEDFQGCKIKQVYKIKSLKDRILIMIYFIIAFVVVTFIGS